MSDTLQPQPAQVAHNKSPTLEVEHKALFSDTVEGINITPLLEPGASKIVAEVESLGEDATGREKQMAKFVVSSAVKSRQERKKDLRAESESVLRGAVLEKKYDEAQVDSVTGLPNRAVFDNELRRMIMRGDRDSALIILDANDFKIINDTLGHAWGDKALREIAERLESQNRPSDEVFRIGGDEFAVLLRKIEAEDLQSALVKAVQRRINAVGEEWFPEGLDKPVDVSVSAGGALFENNLSAEELYERADAANYKNKRTGKAPPPSVA